MGEKLNNLTKDALNAGAVSLRALAEEAGLHKVTVAKWSNQTAGVGADSAIKLARVLDRRALRLLEAAARLRAQAEQEGGNDE